MDLCSEYAFTASDSDICACLNLRWGALYQVIVRPLALSTYMQERGTMDSCSAKTIASFTTNESRAMTKGRFFKRPGWTLFIMGKRYSRFAQLTGHAKYGTERGWIEGGAN